MYQLVSNRVNLMGLMGATLLIVTLLMCHSSQAFWLRYGGDIHNTNSSLQGPNKADVPNLTRGFEFHINVSGFTPSITSQITAIGNTIYHGDDFGVVSARDAKTGSIKWSFALPGNNPAVTNTILVQGAHLYVTDNTSRTMYKLHRATGAIIWSSVLSQNANHLTSGSPVHVLMAGKEMIIQGLDAYQNTLYLRDQNGDVVLDDDGYGIPLYSDNPNLGIGQLPFDVSGRVLALDASDGTILWNTKTTQAGEYGVGVWSTAAIDNKRELAFIGTGQSYNPPPDRDNSHACAILVIDLNDGDIVRSHSFRDYATNDESCVWSAAYPAGVSDDPNFDGIAEALTPGVSGDNDLGSSPVLYSVGKGNEKRDLVAAMNKAGRIKAFDRETGELVWSIRPTMGSITASPGIAYANGVIYAPTLVENFMRPRVGLDGENGINFEAVLSEVLVGAQEVSITRMTAIDAKTGNILWTKDIRGHSSGAPTFSKDVIYHGGWGGQITALDATNGDILFEDDLPVFVLFPDPFLGVRNVVGNAVTIHNKSVYFGSGIQFIGGGLFKYEVQR